ncbi:MULTISPECIES: PoNe immunity protein domain-containing protein [unclassified Streptococcus]|uniref:PoNe immunity protein domain-containing protein n=1 Tax=unclassified Streptococcus TaxID=2608887 RepID=UPI00142F64CC|nr:MULTISPECIES: PoNe immunity protein domain-containing protein [unclassified Streptococcus]MBF0787321.1 DUF1911 domain-containing protein [Streptococcus sp. 19428wC2_LYSM12]MCQ9212660.1 PoNi-like cognate immunity protein [Streptococcus sp. B01]MCQ9213999.1 PoNi-like cognate immunity protein [Streptococcus sp. O1]
MIRDKLKDNNYFDLYLSNQIEDLAYYEKTLYQIEASKEKVIKSLKNTIFRISVEILIARYSKGDNLAVIKEEYINCIPKFKAAFSEIIDTNSVQFIALGTLLNIDLSEDEELLSLIEQYDISYSLVEIFVNKNTDIDVRLYKDIKRFRPWIAEFYNKPDEREAIISKQLSNWYRSQRSSYFFGYDKEEEPFYFGYWALEIAALVKVLNIPDDSFSDHKYYPYDLVHFGG